MVTAPLVPGLVVAARYELERPLAAGHDARSWLARDTGHGRRVVLRFRAVAAGADPDRIAAAVSHPSLLAPEATLQLADHGTVDVFPWLAGGEIGRLRGRAWPLVLRRALPVADALARLHAAGWVHGDVKSSNVLLDDDGLAHLADLGSARRIGAPAAPAASPYSTSPERLDGAPAAAADDAYAFGVLLYELLSGHPPFYPGLTPERVRHEVPAAVTGRPAPPPSLVDLVGRCLAKQAAGRPTLAAVRDEIERCLEQESMVPPAPATDFTPRPPLEAAPIRPRWERSATATRSEHEVRREGFRRGLLAGAAVLAVAGVAFTFFVLPDLVEQRQPAAPAVDGVPATAAAPAPAAAEVDLERLAQLKRRAEERREPLPERLARLEQRDVASWDTGGLAEARAALGAGDAAMESRDYAQALRHFDALAERLARLERRLPEVVRERLQEARAAFDAGRSQDAATAYAAALRAHPDNPAARRGLERAKVLDAVLREVAAATRAEQAGDAAAATAAYRRALALDAATASARSGLDRLQARAREAAYAAALAQGQAALARRDYAAARTAFARAQQVRPGSPEAAEGLRQVQRATETRQLAGTLERAAAAESAEQWSAALALHREALQVEPTLRAAQEGVERVEPRAALDAELQAFLDRPERAFSAPARDVARNVLERAARVPAPGPRLQSQVARLQRLLRDAETPVRVVLTSDNATDVQIYRVGKLGAFERRDLELMPGRYTVVGTRAGYRDVRRELAVLPGAPPPTLAVHCEERI